MSVYTSVAMVVHPLNRIEVLGADCDFACVHNALADLPRNSSNAGWKYLPGEQSTGYVTGEDDDRSADAGSLQEQSVDCDGRDEGSVASSSMGEGGGGGRTATARVPFQQLIDLSIEIMHKIPPRNLLKLAQRYHNNVTLQPLTAQASSIAMLQPPPSWGLASTTESDWILRQRLREECGQTKLNRHQRRNRNKLLKQGIVAPLPTSLLASEDHNPKQIQEKEFPPPSLHAVIASGTGPDGRAEANALRKKRRMMARSSALALVLSVLVGFAKRKNSALPPPISPKMVGLSPLHAQEKHFMRDGNGNGLMSEQGHQEPQKDTTVTKVFDNNDEIESGDAIEDVRGDKAKVQGKQTAEEKKNVPPRKHKRAINDACDHDEPQTDTTVTSDFDDKDEIKRGGTIDNDVREDKGNVQGQQTEEDKKNIPPRKQKRTINDACNHDEINAAVINNIEISKQVERKKSTNKPQHSSSTDRRGGPNLLQNHKRKSNEPFDNNGLQHSSPTCTTRSGLNSLPQVVLSKVLLFIKNITRIQTYRLLRSQQLRSDQLEHHLDMLISKFTEKTKACWSKISPLILKGLRIGRHHLKLKSIALASVFKKKLSLQLENEEVFKRSKEARVTWKKQHAKLKKYGGILIHRPGKILLSAIGKKYTKGKKDD